MSVQAIASAPNKILDAVEKNAALIGGAYGAIAWSHEIAPSTNLIDSFVYEFLERPVTSGIHPPNLREALDFTLGHGMGSNSFKANLVMSVVGWGFREAGVHPLVTKVGSLLYKSMSAATIVGAGLGLFLSMTHAPANGASPQKMSISGAGGSPQKSYTSYLGVNKSVTVGSSERVFGS